MLPTSRRASSPAVPGEHIRLGTVNPDAAALDLIVTWWIDLLDDPYLPENERRNSIPLLFEPFCYAVNSRKTIVQDERRREALKWQIEETGKGAVKLHVLGHENPAVLAFLRNDDRADYTPDIASWRRYLNTKFPLERILRNRLEFRPDALFPEIGRRMHTLVVAATGHGKSEVVKAMLLPYAEQPGTGVLLIDPGRTLAVDVARWPELHRSNRLIYIEPELRPDLTVGINPFHGGHLLSERSKNHLAGMIGQAVDEMTARLTDNMATLVTNCAMVLLDEPDASMRDLRRMVAKPSGGFVDERRDRLLHAAYRHPDEEVREFFQYRFDGTSYASSREFLANRIDGIGSILDVRNALFGPGTIDLERELDAGKFVVVNLAKYGDRQQRATIGRLLVTMAAGIASRRAQRSGPYTPVHLVVDEVSAMASGKMIEVLNEARKFGVHATFAQQIDGEGFTREQAHNLVRNTGCRLAATDNPREGAELLGHRGSPDDLPALAPGQFWVRWAGVPGVHTVQVRSDLVVRDRKGDLVPNLDPARWLPDSQWASYVDWLTKPGGYYRPARTRTPLTDVAPAMLPPTKAAKAPAKPAAEPPASTPKRTPGRNTKVPAWTMAAATPEAPKRATSKRKAPVKPPETPSISQTEDEAPD